MKPFDAFSRLFGGIFLLDKWRRPENRKPGKVVESMSPEIREALSNLKSDEIGPNLRVEDYNMMGDDYERKHEMLEFDKKLGFKPPPRKKYDE